MRTTSMEDDSVYQRELDIANEAWENKRGHFFEDGTRMPNWQSPRFSSAKEEAEYYYTRAMNGM